MRRGWHVFTIWLVFAIINLVVWGLIEQGLGIDPTLLVYLHQGLWICMALNTLYLAIFAHPWASKWSWIAKGAPFFSLLHLLLNLLGILAYYQIGGLQHRHSGLGFVVIVLVHLIFVKWALLSILRPHSQLVK
jgi:hypothetical protein